MLPLIGLTSSNDASGDNYNLGRPYIDAIKKAGGIPILVPSIDCSQDAAEQFAKEIVVRVDGIILTGGPDVNPLYYGEEPKPSLGRVDPLRDVFESALAKEALKQGKPILGICRGSQLLNTVAGGSLHQDIPSLNLSNPIKHSQNAPVWSPSHRVILEEESTLKKILGDISILVNSFHHQAVKDVAPGFRICARASDGVNEAIEKVDHPFTIGLQWHPECLLMKDSPEAFKIFKSFIEVCTR